MTTRDLPFGFTLVELLVAITLMGIALALAAPRFGRVAEGVRVRRTLDLLVSELYRTRMTAVEVGGATQLLLVADAEGCTRALRLQRTVPSALASSEMTLDLPNLCLRHTGDSIVAFNGRGMLRPPTRSFFISHGVTADSVVISIAGRVRRSYRRKRRKEKLSPSGNYFRPTSGVSCRKLLRCNEIQSGTEFTPALVTEQLTCPLSGAAEKMRRCVPTAGQAASQSGSKYNPQLGPLRPFESRCVERALYKASGFSLIEILVAMVILSIGIMGLQAVAMSAVRTVAIADRQTRVAAHASDSLEAALYRLRSGMLPSELCVTLPPFGDQLSRRVSVTGSLATVTVTILPSRSFTPSPRAPLDISSSIFVPAAPEGGSAGSACR